LLEDVEVVSAATVEAALSVLIERRVDVVLLDYNLQGKSGEVVAERPS
jgi:DNA-binding response OmpR family regulator